MEKYIFKKGELNSLNNINQDLKTIFSTYALCESGLCVGENVLNKGIHWCTTEYKLPGMVSTDIPVINSTNVYQAVKSNKKDIIGYAIKDNKDIVLITNSSAEHKIGVVMAKTDIAFAPYDKKICDISSIPQSIKHIELSEDDVEDMVKNDMKNISWSKYRTRITREVIPGLKKSHTVSICFSDINDSIFNLMILTSRATITSTHVYKCIYI